MLYRFHVKYVYKKGKKQTASEWRIYCNFQELAINIIMSIVLEYDTHSLAIGLGVAGVLVVFIGALVVAMFMFRRRYVMLDYSNVNIQEFDFLSNILHEYKQFTVVQWHCLNTG